MSGPNRYDRCFVYCLTSLLLMTYMTDAGTGIQEVLDLTHTLDGDAIFWPTTRRFQMDIIHRDDIPDGWWYETEDISSSTHGGTHLDSPSHFSKGKWRIHEIPIERFMAPLVLVDIRHKAVDDSSCQLSINDLQKWEENHGRIPDGAVVVMNSGWSNRWPNEERVLGTRTKDEKNLKFPGFHPVAARWLVENRNIYGIGVDTPSADHGPSKDFLTHRTIAAANLYILENVKLDDRLPPSGANVMAFPTKIRDSSGAPCRVVAFLPKLSNSKKSKKSKTKIVRDDL